MNDGWYFPTTIGLHCANLVFFWSRTLVFVLSVSLSSLSERPGQQERGGHPCYAVPVQFHDLIIDMYFQALFARQSNVSDLSSFGGIYY